MTNLKRFLLTLASLIAGVLNGSPLAALILIFMVYLLCVLKAQAGKAWTLYYAEVTR